MIIQTNFGDFGSFADLEIFMRQERLETIEVVGVHYWFINLSFTAGTYTYQQILEILEKD